MNGFSAPSLSAPSMSMPSAPSLSGPFTDSQQEQMKREAQELLETFAKIYLRCYKSELVAKVKKDLRGPEESPYKLLQRPDGNKPVTVFTGLVTKRGAFIKNWKQRHFVIRSDGSCDYFASENDSKPKGSIVLEGYSVKESPSSDILAGKEHAFILEHYDEDKRVWYLHCESAESKAQAIQAFTQACRVATGYVNPDAIVRASFAKAHSALRRAYNLFQKTPRGTEKEALGEVVYERLYYTVVSDVVQPLTGVAKSTALKFVRGLISGIVAGAWKGMDEAVSKVRPTIEEGLKKALAPFVEAEDKIKSEIQEKVGEKLINPIVGKVVAPFFAQVVSILYPVVAHAFATQLEISIDVIGKHTGALTPENSQATFKDLNRALDISSATQQLPTKKIDTWISKVEQLLKVAGGLEDVAGVAGSIREVINETLKPAVHIVYPPLIEELMIRASKNTTYTFETLYKESKDATDAANSTHSRLEHDLKVFLKTIINRSLKEFVRKPFDKHIVQPAQDLIAPISESIPEDFKDFVDPESLLDDILEQTLDDAIEEAGGPGVSEMSLKLDGIMQQKGLNILS